MLRFFKERIDNKIDETSKYKAFSEVIQRWKDATIVSDNEYNERVKVVVLFAFVGTPHQFGAQCLGEAMVVPFNDFDDKRSLLQRDGGAGIEHGRPAVATE